MASYATFPLEVRLNIYEKCLADWLDAPGICTFPLQRSHAEMRKMRPAVLRYYKSTAEYIARAPKIKRPVPPVLQAEAGETRSHLLKWLAKHKGMSPGGIEPTLKFPDRPYNAKHDFLYLQCPGCVRDFSASLHSESRGEINLIFGSNIRRIALPASIRHTVHLPLCLKRLSTLYFLEELAFAFVELDRGELKYIDSVPKKNPTAYTMERLRDGDIADYRRKLSRSIEGLDAFIRPMLGRRHAKNLQITACKMIPRC